MAKKNFTMPDDLTAKIKGITAQPEAAFLTPTEEQVQPEVMSKAEFTNTAAGYLSPEAEDGAEQAYKYYLDMKAKHPEGKDEDLIKNALGLSHLYGMNKAESDNNRTATGSINEAIQEAAQQRKRKEYARGALLLEKQLYEDSRAYAERHNLSFNALVITLLKLALEKEERN